MNDSLNLSPAVAAIVDETVAARRPGQVLSPAIWEHTLAQVAQRAYTRGRHDAIAELRTAPEVAAELGVNQQRVHQLARARGVGWRIGRDWLFRPEDVEAMRQRRIGRPRITPA